MPPPADPSARRPTRSGFLPIDDVPTSSAPLIHGPIYFRTERTMPTTDPWARQRGETTAAYRGFIVYRDLGLARNLTEAQRRYAGANGNERGSKTHNFGLWSSKHGWVERARAWDNHLQRQRDEVVAEAASRWERRRQESREELWILADKIRDRVLAMLDYPFVRTRKEGPDGVVIFEPASWNQRDIALMAKTSAELARLAIDGYASDQQPQTAPTGKPSPSDMTADAAAAVMRALAEHRLANESALA
jgi:hypothetical protein